MAAYCDRVLHERMRLSASYASLTITIAGPAENLPPGKIRTTVALGFKRGDYAAKTCEVSLTMRGPDGKKAAVVTTKAEFGGDGDVSEGGAFVEVDLVMNIEKPGLST
jgi:hypothetical protein